MKKFLGALATLLTPFATFAQITVSTGPNAGNILQTIGTLLGRIIPILITLGLVYFIWGMVNYIIAKDDTKKAAGRDVMLQGIIALFLMVSIFGVIRIVNNTFGIQQGGTLAPSQIPGVVL